MSASESHGLNELGPFRVDPEKETLCRAGEPVPLTPKTFQILLVLVRHSKEVVTTDDLLLASSRRLEIYESVPIRRLQQLQCQRDSRDIRRLFSNRARVTA
jgi:DNA-binding response OmpR family regulator